MTINVGINSFGRIGRQVLKAILERHSDTLKIVGVNAPHGLDINAHMLKYDSIYGIYPADVSFKGDSLIVNDQEYPFFCTRIPSEIPWKSVGADIVIECSGSLTDADKARAHIGSGAKKIIISAPSKKEDVTVVMGVNHEKYDPAKHSIISNASCTTNCLAPPAFIVNNVFGIEKGLMNTIHSYTRDQRILDLPHNDYRRARAGPANIVPTTSGAAKALALVIPELEGKFDGLSLRVPTPTVSVVDFTAILRKSTTTDELRQTLKEASEGQLKGIMGYEDKPLVSTDFIGNSISSIVDGPLCQVMGGNFAKVIAWYDNEWGYSCRVADLAAYVASKGV